MNRQTVKRLMTKGIMIYIAVFALVLMVAMPALALMANSVGTNEIRDHSIRSADIRNKAVTTDRIAPRAVRRGKIAKRAIRNEHIYNIGDSKIRYSTKTGYLTIPVAALTPYSDDTDYTRSSSLRLISGGENFYAAVYLSQNAVVKRFTYHHLDNTTSGYTYAKLKRRKLDQSSTTKMADSNDSADGSLWTSKSDSSIEYNPVDNSSYAYYVEVSINFASTNLRAGDIVIEYTYSSPGS